jgi:hypothetical protein
MKEGRIARPAWRVLPLIWLPVGHFLGLCQFIFNRQTAQKAHEPTPAFSFSSHFLASFLTSSVDHITLNIAYQVPVQVQYKYRYNRDAPKDGDFVPLTSTYYYLVSITELAAVDRKALVIKATNANTTCRAPRCGVRKAI